MKVKTLLHSMMYSADEAELYDDRMTLISKMAVDTLEFLYGDARVKKWHLYIDADGLTIIELILACQYDR